MEVTFPGWEDSMGMNLGQPVTRNGGRNRASLSPRCSIRLATAIAFVIVASCNLTALTSTISVNDVIVKPDQVGNMAIKMDYLPNGLSGYSLQLKLSESNIGVIKDVSFVAFDGASSFNISSDGSQATLSAYDLENTVQPGDSDVELAKVQVQGVTIGESAILLNIKRIEDEDGNPVNPQISTGSLRVTEIGPPTATFSFSPPEPTDLDTVRFQDQSTDPDGRIASWQWDFGDGATSSEKNPSHKYADNGTYQVILIVIDDDGATDTVTRDITVSNVAPKADFAFSPQQPTDLDTIHFTDQSSDQDGKIVSWKWVFGDGKTSNEQNPSHRYLDEGTYTISLTVTDEDHATHELSKDIKILNVAPTAEFTFSPVEPRVNQGIEFEASNSKDPDGKIVSYEWDWDNDGTFDEKTNTPIRTYSFEDPGDYTVVLRVIDDDGASNAIKHTITVKVINREPSASFTFRPTNPEVNQRITFDASASRDTDGTITRYEWDWNANANFDSSANSPIAYHSFASAGNHQVTVRVTDNYGATATTARTVGVAFPQRPIARFSFSPIHPTVGSPTVFDATSSHGPNGGIAEYAWDFNNDGMIEKRASDPVTKHTFSLSGSHQVRLVVSSSRGLTAEITHSVEVFSSLPSFFVSAGVASSNPITIVKGGLGTRLSNDLIGHLAIGFGSGSTTRKGFGATVEATTIDVSLLYRVSESVFVGPGGGLVLLRGHYHIDWPTLGSKSFSREVPVLSLTLAVSFGSVLVAAGLHVILM